MSWTKGQ